MSQHARRTDAVSELETEELRCRKELDRNDGTITELRYTIQSRTDVPIACRVRDPLVEDLRAENIYVYPGTDDWHVSEGGAVAFEGALAPESSSSASFTVNIERGDESALLESKPSIGIARPDGSIVVSDHQLRAGAPRVDGERGIDASFAPLLERSAGTTADSRDSERAVTVLADELEAERVPAEEIDRLRAALGIERPEEFEAGTARAKIAHLQQQVADLSAYRDALAEFLDEKGTAGSVIDSFEADIESNRTRLSELETAIEGNEERIDGNGKAIEDNREAIEETEKTIVRTSESIQAVEEKTREGIEAVEEKTRARIEELEGTLETVERGAETRSDEFAADLEVLSSDLEEIRADVEAASAWRESVESAFGARTAGNDDEERETT